MDEKTYYQDENVLITQVRFVTNGKTYAMRNISSVQLGKVSPSGGLFWILILMGCILAAAEGDPGWKVGGIIVGIIVLLLLNSIKTKFSVRINSKSGEVDGLISTDKVYIETIIKAINEAIISYSSSQFQTPHQP